MQGHPALQCAFRVDSRFEGSWSEARRWSSARTVWCTSEIQVEILQISGQVLGNIHREAAG